MRHLGLIAGVALLVVAGVAAFFAFGRTASLPGGPPTAAASPTELHLASRSRGRLPVRITFASIQTMVNLGLANRFTGEKDDPVARPQVVDDKLSWTVTRGTVAVGPGPVQAGVRRLKIVAPLAGTARLRATVDLGRKKDAADGGSRKLFGLIKLPRFKINVAGDLAGDLTVLSAPELRADYRIVPHLAADVAITRAEVPVRRLGRVDVRAPVQFAIDKSKERLVKAAEKRIAESDILRKSLARHWDRLFIVRQVRDDPVTWLVIAPTALEAAQPKVEADALVLGIGVRAETRVVVAAKAPANPPRPLPETLRLIDRVTEGGFDLEIPVSLAWTEINQLANDPKSATRARLKIDALARRHDVTLGKITLRPSGSSVLLAVAMSARTGGIFGDKLDGTLYLVGRPAILAGSDKLAFLGLSHHVSTRDTVATAASWLVSGPMMRALGNGLAIDLKPTLDKAAEKARLQIENGLTGLPGGVSVTVGLDRLTVRRVAVGQTHLHVVMGAKGVIGPVDIDLGAGR